MVTSDGSVANSPRSRSAVGQDEQPWLVKSSSVARVCAWAIGRVAAEVQATTTTYAKLRCSIPLSTPLRPLCSTPRDSPDFSSRFLVIKAITCHSLQGEGISGRHQLTQDVMQNATVFEVIELVQGVDPADQRHPLEAPVRRDDLGKHPLARLDLAMQAADGHLLVALEAEGLPGRPLLEA